MYILGISSYYHDSAAALIKDGAVINAFEEERFSRIKHDNNFPIQALNTCLSNENISINNIDVIAYYEKPLRKFERILDTFIQTYPNALKPFLIGIPEWLQIKINIESNIRKRTGFRGKILFIPHHTSHAAATFFPSPFTSAAVMTIDGVGEYQTTSLWLGEKNILHELNHIDFPDSLGLLYSTFTSYLGFRVNEDEYKLMGLGAYGKPKYLNEMMQLIDIKKDGSFKLNMNYFAYRESDHMWNKHFEELFGPSRNEKEVIQVRHKNIAASIQLITEEIYLKSLNHLFEITKTENLCISGGVALNAVANGKIYSQTPFKKIYIMGAAGDSGNAIGCALYTYHNITNHVQRKRITSLNLGNTHKNDPSVLSLLQKNKLNYIYYQKPELLVKKIASLLVKNHVIGWFQGRMEFGPRALGNRSILANPHQKDMKRKVNNIKRREQFRPFAGSILQEYIYEYFEVPHKNLWSPFMTFCFQATSKGKRTLPAIIHIDNSCRIQTVNKKDNGIYYDLIKTFHQQTGIPCILNTSFNLKGEPIVENPEQAIHDFIITKMDYLVIDDYLIYKPR